MGQPVVHWELWSKDPERIGASYAKAFDWNVDHLSEIDYRLVDTGGENGINGGIMTPKEGPWPGDMCLYIAVDDLSTHRKKLEAAGAKIIVERQEMPNVGVLPV